MWFFEYQADINLVGDFGGKPRLLVGCAVMPRWQSSKVIFFYMPLAQSWFQLSVYWSIKGLTPLSVSVSQGLDEEAIVDLGKTSSTTHTNYETEELESKTLQYSPTHLL